MSNIKIDLYDDDPTIITINRIILDEDDNIVQRNSKSGIMMSNELEKLSKGQLKLGDVEINLRFDESGVLIQIEIYK